MSSKSCIRVFRFLAIILLFPVLMACSAGGEGGAGGAGGVECELVFEDEFNTGTSPSPANWTIETGYGPDNDGWGNYEWQLYTNSPDNVRVEGGNLEPGHEFSDGRLAVFR
jgi:hypothetical protein